MRNTNKGLRRHWSRVEGLPYDRRPSMAYEVTTPNGMVYYTSDNTVPIVASMANGRDHAGFVIRVKYHASARHMSKDELARLFDR